MQISELPWICFLDFDPPPLSTASLAPCTLHPPPCKDLEAPSSISSHSRYCDKEPGRKISFASRSLELQRSCFGTLSSSLQLRILVSGSGEFPCLVASCWLWTQVWKRESSLRGVQYGRVFRARLFSGVCLSLRDICFSSEVGLGPKSFFLSVPLLFCTWDLFHYWWLSVLLYRSRRLCWELFSAGTLWARSVSDRFVIGVSLRKL